jgi:hypothetical protein
VAEIMRMHCCVVKRNPRSARAPESLSYDIGGEEKSAPLCRVLAYRVCMKLCISRLLTKSTRLRFSSFARQ